MHARDRLAVLELADKLGNVTEACRREGWSRDSFYRFRRWYERGGEAAFDVPAPAPRSSRHGPEIQQLVLAFALDHPRWGRRRVARRLSRGGLPVAATTVRAILEQHGLGAAAARAAARGVLDDAGRAFRELQAELCPRGRDARGQAVWGIVLDRVIDLGAALGRATEVTFVEPFSGFVLATLFSIETRAAARSFLEGLVAARLATDGVVLGGARTADGLPAVLIGAVARALDAVGAARRATLRARRWSSIEEAGAALFARLGESADRPAPGPTRLGRSPRATLLAAVSGQPRAAGTPRALALSLRCATPSDGADRRR